MTSVPSVTLNNGVTIPQLGFGTYQIEPKDTRQSVLTALEIGLPATSTPPKCTATRKRSARPSTSSGRRGGGGLRHQQAQQRLPRLR